VRRWRRFGAAAAASCSGSAVLLTSSDRSVHTPNPIIRAAVNQTNPDLAVLPLFAQAGLRTAPIP